MAAMNSSYDVVICGGAVHGSALAYWLARDAGFDGSVLVVERDFTYDRCSTARSAAGIRHQFSQPLNVALSQFGTPFLKNFPEEARTAEGPGPELALHEHGYLFLARTAAQVQVLRENHDVQKRLGADVALLTADELVQRYPHLRAEDVLLASLGLSGEGWFDNMGLLSGLRRAAKAGGVTYTQDEVVGLEASGGRVAKVRLRSGTEIACGHFVNAAGPRAAQVAAMLDIPLPVEPRKRTIFVIRCETPPPPTAPLMIDADGVFCRPEGDRFITGISPEVDPVPEWDDFEPRWDEFEDILWPSLAARSPNFEAIRMERAWAGHYAYNTLDQNAIVGPHPEIGNFLFSNGYSGHGLQQSPGVGRALAEWIVHGRYVTLDLGEMGYERIAAGRPFLEKAII